jgi:hypothetical protein
MNERQLAAFAGPVHWRIAAVTRALLLQGTARESGEPLEVRFNEGRCEFGDTELADVTVYENTDGSATRGSSAQWWLEVGAQRLAVQAGAVQVHVDARRRFLAAVPGHSQTFGNRVGWLALLSLLRLPGGARLIQWVRSR